MTGHAHTRNLLGPLLHRLFHIRLTGAHHLPRRGAVLAIANHPGLLDASLLAVALPRPMRVVVDSGVIPGVWHSLASASGRILIDEGEDSQALALREAVDTLTLGGAVAVFPEGELSDGTVEHTRAAAAYAQIRTACPVVPIALFGTHGSRPTDPPSVRSVIDVVIGPEWWPPTVDSANSRSAVIAHAELLRQHLADHVVHARARTARAGVRGGTSDTDNGVL